MKDYPSILSSNGQNFTEFKAHVFDKLDGSNLRFEWAKKSSWFKYGTRTRLFDESDEVFGSAISLFHNTLAEPLERIAIDNNWKHLIIYAEWFGPSSFAGNHIETEEKELVLFDVAADKKGIMGPKDFLKLFDKVKIPNYLGMHNWTRGFVDKIRNNELEGVTFEGVIGKAGEGHKLIMRKAKTQVWVDAVRARYTSEEAEKLIKS